MNLRPHLIQTFKDGAHCCTDQPDVEVGPGHLLPQEKRPVREAFPSGVTPGEEHAVFR